MKYLISIKNDSVYYSTLVKFDSKKNTLEILFYQHFKGVHSYGDGMSFDCVIRFINLYKLN